MLIRFKKNRTISILTANNSFGLDKIAFISSLEIGFYVIKNKIYNYRYFFYAGKIRNLEHKKSANCIISTFNI